MFRLKSIANLSKTSSMSIVHPSLSAPLLGFRIFISFKILEISDTKYEGTINLLLIDPIFRFKLKINFLYKNGPLPQKIDLLIIGYMPQQSCSEPPITGGQHFLLSSPEPQCW